MNSVKIVAVVDVTDGTDLNALSKRVVGQLQSITNKDRCDQGIVSVGNVAIVEFPDAHSLTINDRKEISTP
jgi:hypothetical protein